MFYLTQTYSYVKLRYAYFILFSFKQVFSFNKANRSNLEKAVTIAPGLPYIIGFSETWLNDQQPSFVTIDGFTFYTNNREHKRGGGVGFYVSNNLKVNELNELYVMSDVIECIFIQIELPDKKQIVVGEIYRPPKGSVHDFLHCAQSILSMHVLNNKKFFFNGRL